MATFRVLTGVLSILAPSGEVIQKEHVFGVPAGSSCADSRTVEATALALLLNQGFKREEIVAGRRWARFEILERGVA